MQGDDRTDEMQEAQTVLRLPVPLAQLVGMALLLILRISFNDMARLLLGGSPLR